MKIRSFLAVVGRPADPAATVAPPLFDGDEWEEDASGAVRLWYRPRSPGRSDLLLLGDAAEGSGAPISLDRARQRLIVQTSTVGLPPVFVHHYPRGVIVASDLYLIAALPDVSLEFDPQGLAELAQHGHPVCDRTLFRNTRLLPAGSRVVVDASGDIRIETAWQLADAEALPADRLLEMQIAAFTKAVARMGTRRSFLSLTAGLDTRAILVALAAQRRLVPAATMSGEQTSLDAWTAGRLCTSYGIRHDVVAMGERFTRHLPDYLNRSSVLSGGWGALQQAPEVFFYDEMAGRFDARISGNLGNQVGRGGAEALGRGLWLRDELRSASSATQVMLQRSASWPLVGNYGVGNHFAVQQTPYADRELLETLAFTPRRPRGSSESLAVMRMRDLRHRFLGEPIARSFQRALVARHGGPAASIPINYGWRASGGVSAGGVFRGAAAMLGMIVERHRLDDGAFRRLVNRTRVQPFHNFQRPARWFRDHLRDFTADTLASRGFRDAGILDAAALTRMVDEHFARQRDHFHSLTFALDVALAQATFCSKAGIRGYTHQGSRRSRGVGPLGEHLSAGR